MEKLCTNLPLKVSQSYSNKILFSQIRKGEDDQQKAEQAAWENYVAKRKQ